MASQLTSNELTKATSSSIKGHHGASKLDVIAENTNDELHVEDANEKEIETDRQTLSAIRRHSGSPQEHTAPDVFN